jgi:hypothetical protein
MRVKESGITPTQAASTQRRIGCCQWRLSGPPSDERLRDDSGRCLEAGDPAGRHEAAVARVQEPVMPWSPTLLTGEIETPFDTRLDWADTSPGTFQE